MAGSLFQRPDMSTRDVKAFSSRRTAPMAPSSISDRARMTSSQNRNFVAIVNGTPARSAAVDHPARGLGVDRERLLREHGDPALEEDVGERRVRHRRRADDDRLESIDRRQVSGVRERRAPERGRHRLGGIGPHIGDTDGDGRGRRREEILVGLGDPPGTDDPESDLAVGHQAAVSLSTASAIDAAR